MKIKRLTLSHFMAFENLQLKEESRLKLAFRIKVQW